MYFQRAIYDWKKKWEMSKNIKFKETKVEHDNQSKIHNFYKS